tara:strand:- start:194 stop:760 length:567 start_codon:yes stop_codon:yes gene_type:complete
MKKKNDLIDFQKFIDGDKSVFEKIINKYKPYVYTICISILKNKEDSEEVLQDVFVKIYFSLNKFKGKSSLKTWVYKITYNSCLERLKKNKKRLEIDLKLNEGYINEEDSISFNSFNIDERIKILRESLTELKPTESMVLTFFYLEELSIKEIVEITSIVNPTIKTILHRGRKNLFKKFKLKSKKNGVQ